MTKNNKIKDDAKPFNFFISRLFGILFIIAVVIIFCLCVITYIWPKKWLIWYPVLAANANRLLCRSFGLKQVVSGEIPKEPVIIASLHQSIWETSALNSIFPTCAFALKKEILFYPLVGFFLWRAGMIYIDRAKGSESLRKLITGSKRVLEIEKRPLIVFPEGTRRVPGQNADLHMGVYLIYRESNVPVVPLVLDSGIYWPKKSFPVASGTIHLKLGKKIMPGLSRREFEKELKQALYTESDKLLAEHNPNYFAKIQKERQTLKA